MKKTTTPLHLFKNESKNTNQDAKASYHYPSNKDLVKSILAYTQATDMVNLMNQNTVIYWN